MTTSRLKRALKLNAFVHSTFQQSVTSNSSASSSSSSLLSIKSNLCVIDTITTAGSKALLNYKAVVTSVAVERALDCGAKLVGSTNMDEFGMGSSSTFSVHGPVFNPFSLPWVAKRMEEYGYFSKNLNNGSKRRIVPKLMTLLANAVENEVKGELGWLTAGGSSGGAAVSVATGSVKFALASDTGGSIRLPSAFCGCVGFKPSYGRVPRWGLIAYASSLDTIGFISDSVMDAAKLYFSTAGHDDRDDTSIREPRRPVVHKQSISRDSSDKHLHSHFLSDTSDASLIQSYDALDTSISSHPQSPLPIRAPLKGLRVGLPIEYRVNSLNTDILYWWERSADLLRQAGAEVVPVSLPHTTEALKAYYTIAAAEAASNLARFDGLRYGYHSSPLECGASVDVGNSNEEKSHSASKIPSTVKLSFDSSSSSSQSPSLLFSEFHARNRNESFGPEVKRRIARGNFLLSVEGTERGEYVAALDVRRRVRMDFGAVFRVAPDRALAAVNVSPLALLNEASQYSKDRTNDGDNDKVDVLLAPVSPSHPWLLTSAETLPPEEVYANDVLTVPASLAHLPSISIPVGYSPYPPHLVDIALAHLRKSTSNVSIDDEIDFKQCALRNCKLPVSLQLIGRLCDEETVLAVASVLEESVRFKKVDHLSEVVVCED
jgi:aspartyl-tRNA(Asn)/glutamyl-tRNA(Gln) amidotransferase subunit A